MLRTGAGLALAGRIVRAQEDERQRIARDLHDVSVQSAVLICQRLDAAAATPGDDASLGPIILETRAVAEEMLHDLCRFSRELRLTSLDDLGLVPALRGLATEFSERTGTSCWFTLNGDPPSWQSGPGEIALYGIAQEAFHNIERHSGAMSAEMSLRYGSGLVLAVSDNGHGFSISRVDAGPTNGRLDLLGMRERARLCGGECTIRSSPGAGTYIEVQVPAALS